jgi:uncharacterized protein YciI
MFVVLLTYVAPLEALDAKLAEHRAWLQAGIESGRMFAAGRQVPRTGGVLLARGADRAEVEAWAATDPFALAGLTEWQVIEFDPLLVAPGLESLKA